MHTYIYTYYIYITKKAYNIYIYIYIYNMYIYISYHIISYIHLYINQGEKNLPFSENTVTVDFINSFSIKSFITHMMSSNR